MNSIYNLLTPNEVAKELGVSPSTVYRMLKEGELGFVWVRSVYRIPRESLDEYVTMRSFPSQFK